MQDNNIREKCRELATRLYELDGEVYKSVGSSLGRTFTGDREGAWDRRELCIVLNRRNAVERDAFLNKDI